MFARVTTLQGSPDSVDAGTASVRDEVLPAARGMAGFMGMIALGDRSTGKMIGITLWESEDAMRASEEAANQLRQSAADAGSAQIAGVERFEVVLDERM
jgi:heme-degrading monooxygenase HmoA